MKHKGFTLIELMIVVAIIGVLTTIALPQYQNYVSRSKLTTALATLSASKISIEEHIAQTGSFPDGKSAGQTLEDLSINQQPTNANVSLIKTSKSIVLTFNEASNNKDLAKIKIALSKQDNDNWICKTTAKAAITPKHCTSVNGL